MIRIVRTTSENPEFLQLVEMLDEHLARVDGEDHPYYARLNATDVPRKVVLAYTNGGPVGCGAIRPSPEGMMEVKRMFVQPEQIAKVAKAHPELGRLRLVVARAANEQDVMILKAEAGTQDADLAGRIAETLAAQTKLRGEVQLVAPGSLPNDGKVIADERTYG